MELLRVEHLVQKFDKGRFTAVNDISFSINKGEVLGLVGESGCGKTTTGRSIIGLYKITGGKIFFHGNQINGEGLKKRTFVPQIQMIFQDPVGSLDPRMTVGEIIAEGLVIQGIKDKAEISRRVAEVLVKTGLHPEYAGRYPHEFSGGQRQRIGIARAIIMNPELIIADEPVSALDVSVKAQIINLLNDLRREMGLTVLFIAHDLSVVRYFSDRIAVMNRGRIVEMAESSELFNNPCHEYTKALLSAVPVPDPKANHLKNRIIYESEKESADVNAVLKEICPGHFVLK